MGYSKKSHAFKILSVFPSCVVTIALNFPICLLSATAEFTHIHVVDVNGFAFATTIQYCLAPEAGLSFEVALACTNLCLAARQMETQPPRLMWVCSCHLVVRLACLQALVHHLCYYCYYSVEGPMWCGALGI